MKRDPYPLQWPDGWKRSTWRKTSRFVARFALDRDHVIRQLRGRGGSHIVITSDLPTRNDGLPYANATCTDPGIAVWWIEKGKQHVMACDRWRTAAQNLRAIDKSLNALRDLDRWGTSETVERAFAGFAALPAGNGVENNVSQSKPWREVLGMYFAADGLNGKEQLVLAKLHHRRLIKEHHPDVGGSHERAAELNAALAEAEQELGVYHD